jgi:hypothetical protein
MQVALRREAGIVIGRDQTARLMRELLSLVISLVPEVRAV